MESVPKTLPESVYCGRQVVLGLNAVPLTGERQPEDKRNEQTARTHTGKYERNRSRNVVVIRQSSSCLVQRGRGKSARSYGEGLCTHSERQKAAKAASKAGF